MTVSNFLGQTFTLPGPTFDTVTPGSTVTGYLVGGQLTRSSAHDCFLVDTTGVSNPGVQLPPDSEIGDLVEVYVDRRYSVGIYAPSGESFGEPVDTVNGNSTVIGGSDAPGVFLRKLTSVMWGIVR